jgi:hypothetical protein
MHASFHRSAFNRLLRSVPVTKSAQLLDDTIAACLLEGGTWYKKKCEKSPDRRGD